MTGYLEKAMAMFLMFVACVLAVLFTVAVGLLVFVMLVNIAKAQEHHMHGNVQADADWFDEACCTGKDCQRIGAEEVVRDGDIYIWTSKRTGKVHKFHKDARMNWKMGTPSQDNGPKIRNSQDGYFYGCEYPIRNEHWQITDYQGRCLYLPILM